MTHNSHRITASSVRLQVYLSRNGICSRRKAFDYIKEGHVSVNGKKVYEPSTQVKFGKDKVRVDGKLVEERVYEYILLNKIKGYVTTKAERYFQKNVFDILPTQYRHLSPVGRLDMDTEGLLLFTNDGDVAYALTHPKFQAEKKYFVKIMGNLSLKHKRLLEKGILIENKKTSPARISNVEIKHQFTELQMTIHEGMKRQIRMMFAMLGYRVIYLKRVSQGPITLGNLRPGKWRSLSDKEIRAVKKLSLK